MNLVDSSAWLEYFGNGANAKEFAQAIEDVDRLVVPSICVYEVFKRTRQLAGESTALAVAAVMLEGEVADVTAPIAIEAARLSADLSLAMADSIILATARANDAVLWTQDAAFEGIEGVQYRRPARR